MNDKQPSNMKITKKIIGYAIFLLLFISFEAFMIFNQGLLKAIIILLVTLGLTAIITLAAYLITTEQYYIK